MVNLKRMFLAILTIVYLTNGAVAFFGGRRRRRFSVRIPPVRIPPVRIPPVRIPPVRIPPVRIPPVRIPPVRLPPVRIPPVRLPPVRIPPVRIPPIRIPPIRIPPVPPVRVIIRVIGDGVIKGFNILTQGCCGLHPSYCSNRKEFERRKNEINLKSKTMDKQWAAVKKKLAQIKSVNHNNQVVFRNVRRVTLSSTLTVQTLDPSIIAKMNNVSNELKKALKAKNDTVLQYGINEVGKEFEKTEDKSKTELLDASGIGGFGMTEGYIKMTADMFKLVKLDGVAKFLTNDVLGLMNKAKLQISKLFGFHYLEKLAKNNAALKIVFGVLKFYNEYLNVFGGIFKVMELFGKFTAWITDLVTCKKRKNEMEAALKDLKAQHVKMNDAYKKLQETQKKVNTNWIAVFKEAKQESLLSNLLEVEKIAQHSSSSSPAMKKSLNDIKNYRMNIAKSTPDGVVKLQQTLVHAVSNVTFNADCYQRKTATYISVAENCRLGKGSFDELYEKALIDFATNGEECKGQSGLPYTTKDDVRKYVQKKAKKLNFETTCLLNSGVKRAVVCNQLHAGYTVSQAANSANINTTIASLYQQSCSISSLSPKEKESICFMKAYRSPLQIKQLFSSTDPQLIIAHLKKCE